MSNYTDWIPALTIAAIVIAVALLWIGIEIYQIRQSIQDRAARATQARDRINAYYQTAATSLREQTEAGIIKRK